MKRTRLRMFFLVRYLQYCEWPLGNSTFCGFRFDTIIVVSALIGTIVNSALKSSEF